MKSERNIRVLYVGALFKGSTAVHRMTAMKEIGLHVDSIDASIGTDVRSVLFRIFRRLGFDIDFQRISNRISAICDEKLIDLVWIDKGWLVNRKVISKLKAKNPQIKVVHYSPDDMLNPGNQTSIYLRAVPVYDLHVTTKSFNVAELKVLGAKDVLFVASSYDRSVHRPLGGPLEPYTADVSFVGALEADRVRSIKFLANNGIKVTVWTGPKWRAFFKNDVNVVIKEGWFAEDEYTKIICGAKIVLCFLRKVNRDLHTQRSVEIPACGAFMIGERTEEHCKLFVEGREAEFFSSDTELLEKIQYYLCHDEERMAIAERARTRCVTSGYDNASMVKKVLTHLF